MTVTQQFLISDSAAQRIVHLIQDEPGGSRLRIRVDGGGCSGFQYHFDFDTKQTSGEDIVFIHNDAEVIIDDMSLEFLQGSMIDYVEELGASYFQISNPNSTASCGCGNSFSV